MKQVFALLLLGILAHGTLNRLLKVTKQVGADERELATGLVTAKPTENRKLGLEEDLQREHEDEQNVGNMKLMIINMKKEGELRSLESIISDIGDRVEEINDTVRSKTNEFIDKVDSVRKAKNKVTNVVAVQKEGAGTKP